MLDAINIHKTTKKNIKEAEKRIERRIEKIETNIIQAINRYEFKLEYGLEKMFSEQIIEYFRDSGFDVEYNKVNQTLSISWEFKNYPINYFIHMENLKEYKKSLKVVEGKEFSDIIESLDPLKTRDILMEIRHLLKGRNISFHLEELDDYDYPRIKKMLEMMGLAVNPKEVEFCHDYTIYKNIEIYIGAN